MPLSLAFPNHALLASYQQALSRGWAGHEQDPDTASRMLAACRAAPDAYLLHFTHCPLPAPNTGPDAERSEPCLPHCRFWISNGEYCGELSLRWPLPGDTLPADCPGHLAWSVVPWQRGHGYACQAVQLLLPRIAHLGLPWLDMAMATSNIASWKTAEHLGAIRIAIYQTGAEHGHVSAYRYRLMP